jgi:hypothetical protein
MFSIARFSFSSSPFLQKQVCHAPKIQYQEKSRKNENFPFAYLSGNALPEYPKISRTGRCKGAEKAQKALKFEHFYEF